MPRSSTRASSAARRPTATGCSRRSASTAAISSTTREQEAVIERHGAFYETFVDEAEEGLRGPEAAEWLRRVDQELPNLRAAMARALERGSPVRALRMAAGVGRYWHARSSQAEGRGWLDQALAEAAAPDADRAKGCFVAATLAFFQGDLAAAEKLFAAAAAAAKASGDVVVEATALAHLRWVARERGYSDTGRAELERSRELYAGLTDERKRLDVLLSLSVADLEEGDVGSQAPLKEFLALARELGDLIFISDGLNNLGWGELLADDLEAAVRNLEEAVDVARVLGDTFRITISTCNLGLAAVFQGRYADAIPVLRETVELSIRRGDKRCGSEAVLGLAAAAAGLGENELAARLDAIQRSMMAEAGIVYVATLGSAAGSAPRPGPRPRREPWRSSPRSSARSSSWIRARASRRRTSRSGSAPRPRRGRARASARPRRTPSRARAASSAAGGSS